MNTPLENTALEKEKFLAAMRVLTASIKHATEEAVTDMLKIKASKAGFDPGQPRAPRGNPDGGEWTDTGGGSDAPGGSDQTSPHTNRPTNPQDWGRISPRAGGSGTDHSPSKPIKIHDAVEHLESRAKPQPPKPGEAQCAKYVREAIEAGGIKIKPGDRHESAKDYGTTLEKVGFHPVATVRTGEDYPPKGYKPEKGDVVVVQSTSKSEHGHMAMYSGNQWISDFKQPKFWPGPSYLNEKPGYVLYRAPKE